ncbi:MAG: helix-turn-helix transcriptional regulator [Candidatus Omnitrophica bacterium]|nr:helix-turn-helix transcriptional regulator [Candidatus Omnitrophota bacterium]
MKKIRLENTEKHLKEELKNERFRKAYELESAKVALAQKIAELRQEKHLRQIDLAKKLGTTQQFISQIETGEERNLTLGTLIKIAEALGKKITISFANL